jgi:aspartyl/asparaginyl-tRNA synthetase
MMSKMNTKTFPIGFFIICLFSIAVVSCGIGATKISDIVGHPRDYADKEVTISGEVTETFSLFVVKYFVVRDNSGEISVVTEKPLPVKGEKIKVKGTVKETFSFGTKTALVLVETTEKSK